MTPVARRPEPRGGEELKALSCRDPSRVYLEYGYMRVAVDTILHENEGFINLRNYPYPTFLQAIQAGET